MPARTLGDSILTDTIEDDASVTAGEYTRIRVLRTIDRVLKERLGCTDASIAAQLCFTISQELSENPSGFFSELNVDGTTYAPATCEMCVNAARGSGLEDAALAEDAVAENRSFETITKGILHIPHCAIPCFTVYKEVIHDMLDGYAYHTIIRDENGKAVDLEFTHVNPGFEKITGLKFEGTASRRITDVLPKIREDPFDWIGYYDEVAKNGQPVTFQQYSHALSRWYQVKLFPQDSQTLIATFIDITDIKEVKQELRTLNEQLERRIEEKTQHLKDANDELEAFAHSVSHDLRAPLRSVDGFSRALLEMYSDKLDEKGIHYLERMRFGASQMGLLIDDLLKLSRITRRPLNFQDVNLSMLVGEIIKNLSEREPERHVECIVAEDLNACADKGLIRIALTNLLDNAWKFTRRKETATIEVSCMLDKNDHVFFVKDNGVGFDMKYSNKIFAPFQRLHSTHEFEGTGIGLATVQRIIRRHGGKIWVESSPEQGATFFFTLKAGEI